MLITPSRHHGTYFSNSQITPYYQFDFRNMRITPSQSIAPIFPVIRITPSQILTYITSGT